MSHRTRMRPKLMTLSAEVGVICRGAESSARSLVGFRDARDFGAHAGELFFYAFIAPIDMVDPIDDSFAFRGQSGQDQGSAGAKI